MKQLLKALRFIALYLLVSLCFIETLFLNISVMFYVETSAPPLEIVLLRDHLYRSKHESGGKTPSDVSVLPCLTPTMPFQRPLSHPVSHPNCLLSHTPNTHLKLTCTHTFIHPCAHNPDTHPLITHRLVPSLCSRGLMGNLLKVLACAELEHGPIVFLDFERETISFFFFKLYLSLCCLSFV